MTAPHTSSEAPPTPNVLHCLDATGFPVSPSDLGNGYWYREDRAIRNRYGGNFYNSRRWMEVQRLLAMLAPMSDRFESEWLGDYAPLEHPDAHLEDEIAFEEGGESFPLSSPSSPDHRGPAYAVFVHGVPDGRGPCNEDEAIRRVRRWVARGSRDAFCRRLVDDEDVQLARRQPTRPHPHVAGTPEPRCEGCGKRTRFGIALGFSEGACRPDPEGPILRLPEHEHFICEKCYGDFWEAA